MTSMPRAAYVAVWLNAWLHGVAAPDDVIEALGVDANHVFLGLDVERVLGAAEALGHIRRLTSSVSLALTAPGDPAGLGGPPLFNAAAMDSGQALLLVDANLGVVPVQVGGAIEWRCTPACLPAPLDPREARRNLQTTLREVTEELARLEIASWSTEIPDLLMNRMDPVHAPATVSDQDQATLSSAALCLAIVDAARTVKPRAIDAATMSRFEAGMRRLDGAARHALIAVCSSSGAGSDNLASP